MLDCAYEKMDSLIRNNELRLFSDRNNGLNRDKIYLGDIENYIERKLKSNTKIAKAVIKSFLTKSTNNLS